MSQQTQHHHSGTRYPLILLFILSPSTLPMKIIDSSKLFLNQTLLRFTKISIALLANSGALICASSKKLTQHCMLHTNTSLETAPLQLTFRLISMPNATSCDALNTLLCSTWISSLSDQRWATLDRLFFCPYTYRYVTVSSEPSLSLSL